MEKGEYGLVYTGGEILWVIYFLYSRNGFGLYGSIVMEDG